MSLGMTEIAPPDALEWRGRRRWMAQQAVLLGVSMAELDRVIRTSSQALAALARPIATRSSGDLVTP